MMEDITAGFIEEVKDLLLRLEDDLITLESTPGNADTINNVFRVMHTLKGSAGMCGFKNIQDFTHVFESMYEAVREGKLKIDSGMIDLTLQGKDLIIKMLQGESADTEGVVKEIHSRLKGTDHQGSSSHAVKASVDTPGLYLIMFSPDKAIFERGLDPDKTIEELKTLGNTYVVLHEKKGNWEKQKKDKICQTTWEIYLNANVSGSDIEDVFLFYDPEEYDICNLSDASEESMNSWRTKIKKLYKNKVSADDHLAQCLKQLPENLKKKETVVAEVPKPDQVKETLAAETVRQESDSTINVSSHKLDELMNLVSELVTITATLEAHTSGLKDIKMNNAVENIEKLTKKFRNNALDLRLVPVGTLLSRFKRQVRDLSKDLGKKVNLLIEGQDIEIDKTILKAIESPLQHIIRNSIDHGLEPEEERLASGKTPEGLLKITAFYAGASVIIQVQDDGRGIDLERVRECAIKKGLAQSDQTLTKQELINFILEPGFTTSENISMVSGRGVGMDVVRREINSVGGGLEVFTEKDLGTSITMKLPTTLTIIDTLMVEVAESSILIPIMDIEYCFKEKQSVLFNKDNKYIEFKNNPIPLISLRQQFHYQNNETEDVMVIVINKFDRKYAVVADSIVGEHQAVIKPLGDLFMNQPFFSGGSIMTDGKLALILDTNFLFTRIIKN